MNEKPLLTNTKHLLSYWQWGQVKKEAKNLQCEQEYCQMGHFHSSEQLHRPLWAYSVISCWCEHRQEAWIIPLVCKKEIADVSSWHSALNHNKFMIEMNSEGGGCTYKSDLHLKIQIVCACATGCVCVGVCVKVPGISYILKALRFPKRC